MAKQNEMTGKVKNVMTGKLSWHAISLFSCYY